MSIKKLISIAGEPISHETIEAKLIENSTGLIRQLYELLNIKNGFYCLESAVHVFPLSTSADEAIYNLMIWNSEELWKSSYRGMADEILCFAEDIFGNQFGIRDTGVYLFDAETGSTKKMAASLEEWSAAVVEDDYWSGYSLAHGWQEENGALSEGHRLMPVIPFVLGGDFSVENLRSVESLAGMRYRGDLANQIKDLPDGSQIELKVFQ